MAYFHTNVLDNQIKALPTVDTASGSVATFETDLTENLIECVCDIQYSQASGTPTPTNPIPITVYNSLNLSHSGADTSNPTVYNIPFGQTVAKGTLNVTTGVLIIYWVYGDLGSYPWRRASSGNIYYLYTNISDIINPSTYDSEERLSFACDIYKKTTTLTNAVSTTLTDNYSCVLGYNSGRIIIRNDDYSDSDVFKTAMSGKQIVYKLATPITVQLSSNQVQALLNENNIWCDTNGDTSVKFLLTVGKKIA